MGHPLFSEFSVTPGGFNAGGRVVLKLQRPVPVQLPGGKLEVQVNGSAGFDFSVGAEVFTVKVAGVEIPGVPRMVPKRGKWGKIDWVQDGWITAPSRTPEETVPDPTRPPRLTLTFNPSVQVEAQAVDAAKSLFARLSPAAAIQGASQLAELCWAQYASDLDTIADEILSRFQLSNLPFYDQLPAQHRNELSSRVRALLQPRLDEFKSAFRTDLLQDLSGLAGELRAIAETEVNQLGADLEKGAELLLQLGVWAPQKLGELGQRLADAVRQGRSLLQEGPWLLGMLFDRDRAEMTRTFVRFCVAVKDGWATRRGELEQLLGRVDQLFQGADLEMEGFLRTVMAQLAEAPGIQGQLSKHAAIFVDLLDMARKTLAGSWNQVGRYTSEIIRKFGPDFGAFLSPFFSTVRYGKEEFFTFLSHLGNDEKVKQVCAWLQAHWDTAKVAFTSGAEEIKAVIELIVRLAKQLPPPAPELLHRLERFQDVVEWLQGLPRSLVNAREVRDAKKLLETLDQNARRNLFEWVASEARRGRKQTTQVVRDFIANTNPLVAFLKGRGDALWHLLGKAEQAANTTMDAILNASAEVEKLIDDLDALAFSGGAGESPFTVEATYTLDTVAAILGSGAASSLPLAQALADIRKFSSALSLEAGKPLGILELSGRFEKLRVPGPGEMSLPPARTPSTPPSALLPPPVRIPLLLPFDFLHSVSIGHLCDFHVLDLRYDMPYGSDLSYRVADLDGDGFVREWEVEALRHAAGRAEGYLRPGLDCDHDGRITARDVQLAIAQTTGYMNGLVYRRTTAPLGFRIALDERNWLFTGFASLRDESIPGRVHRRGLVLVEEAQVSLPPPLDYPVRYHYEVRYYVDDLKLIEPLGIFTPALSPSIRYDLVLRCGRDGRDLQAYFTTEPLNVLARTFTLRATGYVRGIITGIIAGIVDESGAGVAGKGDVRIHVTYECGSPLAQVLREWQERLTTGWNAGVDALKDPLWAIQRLVEKTNIPRLFRALGRVLAPFLDLFFEWVDPSRQLAAALAYLRHVVLRGWQPAITWKELVAHLQGWPGAQVSDTVKAGLISAVQALRAQLGASEEEPAYHHGLLLFAVRDALQALPGTEQPSIDAARERVNQLFIGQRTRFVAGFLDLVPLGLRRKGDPTAVDVRGVGQLRVERAGILAQASKTDVSVGGQGVSVRHQSGPILGKPVHGTLLRFGRGAYLASAPTLNPLYRIDDVAENMLGTVEGSYLLVDEDGHGWFFVRDQARRYGWIHTGMVLTSTVSTEGGPKPILGKATLDDSEEPAIDCDAFNQYVRDELARAAQENREAFTPIAELEPSPPNTLDDLRYVPLALRAMRGGTAQGDADLRRLIEGHLRWLKFKLFGRKSTQANDTTLRTLFNALTNEEKQVFWSELAAEVKLPFYGTGVAKYLFDTFVPRLLNQDLAGAWEAFVTFLQRCFTFSRQELLVAADDSAPALKDVVHQLVELVVELVKRGMELKAAVGSAPDSQAEKDREKQLQAAWTKFQQQGYLEPSELRHLALVAAQLARLKLPSWIGNRIKDMAWDHEYEEEQTMKQLLGEGGKADAAVTYEAIQDMGPEEREKYLQEMAYRQKVTEELYEKNKDYDWDQRQNWANDVAQRMAQGEPDPFGGAHFGAHYESRRSFDRVPGFGLDGITFGRFATEDSVRYGKKPKEKPDPKRQGEFSLAFGNDTLTVNWSVEGGGGAGVGDEVGGGATGTVSGGIKIYGYMAKVPLSLFLTAKEALAIFLRFFVRVGYHSVDTLHSVIEQARALSGQGARALQDPDRHADWFFSMFALVEALRDVVQDHPAWVSQVLEGVRAECQIDVNGSAVGAVSGSVDANGTVSAILSTKLSTIVAPLLDILDHGEPTGGVAAAADRIVPRVELRVEDRVCVKVGTFPASIEIESRGDLAKARVEIPPGSAIRGLLREWVAAAVRFADAYKKQRARKLEEPLVRARDLFEALDRNIQGALLADDADSILNWASPDPVVTKLVGDMLGVAVQGGTPEAPPVAQVSEAARKLRAARVRGIAIEPGQVLLANPSGQLIEISMYVTDDEKRALEAVGFQPPARPGSPRWAPALENLKYRIPLPSGPTDIGWWYEETPTLPRRRYSGIVAGFPSRIPAEQFATQRDKGWLAAELQTAPAFTSEGRWWTWLDTDLVPRLEQKGCALPRLSLEGGQLVLGFTAVPEGAVPACGARILQGREPVERTKIWRILLVTAGTRTDYRTLLDALARGAA